MNLYQTLVGCHRSEAPPEGLLDGFQGALTSSKWAAMAKCSPNRALRDINNLMSRGALTKMEGGGQVRLMS
ncbi:hypothetical protein [Cupriavidus sp. AU9028]|uniref:hypothetical protein n=1 Tax=Cupriavidus sp. AU9028 TaxID=2871157 RepID=UPI001C9493EB